MNTIRAVARNPLDRFFSGDIPQVLRRSSVLVILMAGSVWSYHNLL